MRLNEINFDGLHTFGMETKDDGNGKDFAILLTEEETCRDTFSPPREAGFERT